MSKKIKFLILFLITISTQSIGQNLDLDYVTDWLNRSNDEYTPELVQIFYINRDYYELNDTSDFTQTLEDIKIADINYIDYSHIKGCNYSPGQGIISIVTKSEKTQEEIKEYIELGIKIYDTKQPMVIALNNEIKNDITFSELIAQLDIYNIYDISISTTSVPKDIYGINSKNGIIKIWTK